MGTFSKTAEDGNANIAKTRRLITVGLIFRNLLKLRPPDIFAKIIRMRVRMENNMRVGVLRSGKVVWCFILEIKLTFVPSCSQMRLQLLHFHAVFKTWPTFQEPSVHHFVQDETLESIKFQ